MYVCQSQFPHFPHPPLPQLCPRVSRAGTEMQSQSEISELIGEFLRWKKGLPDGDLSGKVFQTSLSSSPAKIPWHPAGTQVHSLSSTPSITPLTSIPSPLPPNPKSILWDIFSAFTSHMLKKKRKKKKPSYSSIDWSHYKFLASNLNWALNAPHPLGLVLSSTTAFPCREDTSRQYNPSFNFPPSFQ